MENVDERFLRYVKINTQSKAGCEDIPSTPCQWDLANLLVEELRALGVEDARVDEHCYVMGSIPSNLPEPNSVPALGLIAHMDTATETSGENVNPRIVENYDGGPIVINEELGMVMDPSVFKGLAKHIGDDLIVTDGTTLLGADNKAGVAEIMSVVERLHENPTIPHGKLCIGFTPDEEVGRGADLFDIEDNKAGVAEIMSVVERLHENPTIPHGKLCIGFTPDEEVGRGADLFDIEAFGADLAYTIDGGELGELEYENFNAASAHVAITGHVVHPGSAKGSMRNAALIATRFNELLPAAEIPACTEGREGFYHLNSMSGDVAHAELDYIIRDHDRERFEQRKRYMKQAVELLNAEYGYELATVEITDSYYNMKEMILPHMELIDLARESMEELDIEPLIIAVRGGTDGARLSYMGLPCPNICSGCEYAHGPYEHVSVQALRRIADMLVLLVQKFAATRGADVK